MARAELGQPERQVAVGFDALVVDLHMAGAVHRLERVDALFLRTLLVDLDEEHVLAVGLPVARPFPQDAVDHLRRADFPIAGPALATAHVVLERAVDRPAIGVPEDHAGRLFLKMEQLHFLAEAAVVASRGLFQHREMRLELLAVAEGHAIDALQLLVVAVAAPVGTGHVHQLEGIGGHLPGMLKVWPAAQVLPVAMPIHPDRLILGDGVHQFDLERLVPGRIEGDGVGAAPQFGADRIAGVDDLLHPGLDRAQIFRAERFGPVEVVIPAVRDDRPDRDLHLRPQLLHGARHDMGEVMADQFQRLRLVLHRVDGDAGVAGDRPLEIMVRPVERGGDRLFREAGRDRGRHFAGGHAGCEIALVAIGKGQGNLGHRSFSSSVWRLRNARLRVMSGGLLPLGQGDVNRFRGMGGPSAGGAL